MQHHASMRNQPNFPEEVLQEILKRLPVKSLLRFKSVSKSWLSLISTSHFANLHFQLSSQRILYNPVVYDPLTQDISSQIRSINVNASFHNESAFIDVDFPPIQFEIMGSCRGFLFLVPKGNCKFIIWNPSTLAFRQIPRNPWKPNTFLYGFGYDAATDDYLILLILHFPQDSDASTCVNGVKIFSLRTNSWNNLDHNYPNVSPIDDLSYSGAGCILDGALHWLASRHEREIIIAFDLTHRNFREVPLPDDFNYELRELNVVGDMLCLIVKDIDELDEMWVMREYGVKSSWTKYITMSFYGFPCYILPLCFTKDGLVDILYGTDLIKCNDEGELIERSPKHRRVNYAHAMVYNETLLSLPMK